MSDHIVMLSGGIGSYMVARRLHRQGKKPILLFADTKMEDEDLYRFLDDIERVLDTEIIRLAEGRDPWQVFKDVKFLGNTKGDPCSRILKRQFLRKHIDDHHDPENSIIYIGIDWTEIHRLAGVERYWSPWRVEAPLTSPPYLTKNKMLRLLEHDGIEIPRLYKMGFPHNNCGGFCIKAGIANFALLWKAMPERYRYHEDMEASLQSVIAKPHTILRDRRDGQVKPLSLRQLREDLEKGQSYDLLEWGGCACFTPDEYDENNP
ncbi:MAG: phosphoadenosine phosphosulfate reductase family protein [Gemmatimonadota bacterium]|nr:MAG: phosphoadenosine phosphosulfate reductase family protein [Gemmatimonadota bacterium]